MSGRRGQESLDLRSLTARSVILSVLLGSHPPQLPVRALVRASELFGISEGTVRVALSRLAAEADVIQLDGGYRLSDRLLSRQRRQDEGLRPETRSWRSYWEVAVASPDIRTASERAALGVELTGLRLAELRHGVWIRPDNLVRNWPEETCERAWRFVAKSDFGDPNPAELVAGLWDLDAWAKTAVALIEGLQGRAGEAERFAIAAVAVRHLQSDPMLPAPLLPPRWPGTRLRNAYRAYQREISAILLQARDG